MMQGAEVSIADMMNCRDRRAAKQAEYLLKYHSTIISFCMNIPGPVKTNAQIRKAFELGKTEIDKQLQTMNVSVLDSVRYDDKTGNEILMAVNSLDAETIKNAMTRIEETSTYGRLYDIDVIGTDGRKISRPTYRRCFICSAQAQECASSRRHSVAEMQAFIEDWLRDLA